MLYWARLPSSHAYPVFLTCLVGMQTFVQMADVSQFGTELLLSCVFVHFMFSTQQVISINVEAKTEKIKTENCTTWSYHAFAA